MLNLRLRLFSILIVLTVVGSIAACDNQSDLEAASVARVDSDGALTVLAEPARLAGFFDSTPLGIAPGAESPFTVQFDSFAVERKGDFAYVIGRGETSEGVCYIEAKALAQVPDGDALYLQPGGDNLETPDHSCTGVCCSSCMFTHNSSGEITGCACVGNVVGCTSYCNHTVSGGG